MARVLNSCTDGPTVAPSAESTTTTTQLPPPPRSAPEPTTAPDPPIAPPPTQASVYYPNCAAARAAGAAPLHRGDPGYSAKLDRDNDDVACE
ncbi:excalibur calcium-binding domain-containing protein [Nocardia cyriacigeorgica]|nr:excalibur calcium-binding domain-containing protein [Nocardia cyriacigeorgica]